MSFKIFITANIGDEALRRLGEKGYELDVYDRLESPPKSYIKKKIQEGFDAIITNLRDNIDEEVITAGRERLRIIAQDSAGIDNIDMAAANRYRIPVSNTQDVLTEAVAEFALFAMGNMSRHQYPSERLVREGMWDGWHPFHPFLGREIYSSTVGVIGTGKIGKSFIKKLLGLDVNILMYSRTKDRDFEENCRNIMEGYYNAGFSEKRRTIKYCSLGVLLKNSDIISLHLPLIKKGKDSTFHMISRKEFSLMKKGVCIVNTSRGSIIDEPELINALRDGRVEMAALDVFEKEPLPPDSPLLSEDLSRRVRVFHHFASGGRITRLSLDRDRGMAGRCIYSLISILEGKNPADIPYIVNRHLFL